MGDLLFNLFPTLDRGLVSDQFLTIAGKMDETGNPSEAQPMEIKTEQAPPDSSKESSSANTSNPIPTHESTVAPGSAAPVTDSNEPSQPMEVKSSELPTPETESSKDSSVSITTSFTPASTQDNSMAPGFAAPASSEPVTTQSNTGDALPMDTSKSVEQPATVEDSSKDSSNTPNSTPPLSQEPVAIATGQAAAAAAPVPSSNSNVEPPQPSKGDGDEPNPVESDSSKDSMTTRGESSVPSQEVPTLPPANTASGAAPSVASVPTTNGSNKKPRIDYASLNTRQYLDQTVVPILLQGLSSLAKTRPEDPTKYLATYLLEHKQEYEDR